MKPNFPFVFLTILPVIVVAIWKLLSLRQKSPKGFKPYLEGRKADQAGDYSKAMEWYLKAVNQGNAEAEICIGFLYDKGSGVAQDHHEARRWYQKAAQKGLAVAQNNMGVIYRDGIGVSQDYQEAMKWFQRAAEQEYAWAEYNIGYLYFKGQGVTKDYQKAMEWSRKAVSHGSAYGENFIGYLYENGFGVTKDLQEAARWGRRSTIEEKMFTIRTADKGFFRVVFSSLTNNESFNIEFVGRHKKIFEKNLNNFLTWRKERGNNSSFIFSDLKYYLTMLFSPIVWLLVAFFTGGEYELDTYHTEGRFILRLYFDQQIEDQKFWKQLSDETGADTCRHPECDQLSLKRSSMCKKHHFEMVMGHPYTGLEFEKRN